MSLLVLVEIQGVLCNTELLDLLRLRLHFCKKARILILKFCFERLLITKFSLLAGKSCVIFLLRQFF